MCPQCKKRFGAPYNPEMMLKTIEKDFATFKDLKRFLHEERNRLQALFEDEFIKFIEELNE